MKKTVDVLVDAREAQISNTLRIVAVMLVLTTLVQLIAGMFLVLLYQKVGAWWACVVVCSIIQTALCGKIRAVARTLPLVVLYSAKAYQSRDIESPENTNEHG